jgi:hypothetical protein
LVNRRPFHHFGYWPVMCSDASKAYEKLLPTWLPPRINR